MAQPNSSDRITSTPTQPGQPYDAAESGDVGKWAKLPGGPADLHTGALAGTDWDDSPPWRQC